MLLKIFFEFFLSETTFNSEIHADIKSRRKTPFPKRDFTESYSESSDAVFTKLPNSESDNETVASSSLAKKVHRKNTKFVRKTRGIRKSLASVSKAFELLMERGFKVQFADTDRVREFSK